MVPVTLFDAEFREIGIQPIFADIESGDSSTKNDIEITSKLPPECAGIAILETDAGGVIEKVDIVTGKNPVKYCHTWRGLLTQHVLIPPAGSDYLTVNTELNSAIRSVLSGVLGGFFKVPNISTGVNVQYQFNLYTDALTGLSEMCKSVGYKLSVHAEKNANTGKIEVICEAIPAVTYEEEFDEYSAIQMEFIKDNMMYTHLVCRGKGDLQNRVRCELYLAQDGTWHESRQDYTGFYDRQYFYENTGCENSADLKKEAIKKASDLSPYKELKIKKAPQHLEIGDRIKGRYSPEGISVEATINKKIYRVNGDYYTVEYSVK